MRRRVTAGFTFAPAFFLGLNFACMLFHDSNLTFSKFRIFARLRNRGYKKIPLKRLFICVKFGYRMDLLAISLENLDFREIRDTEETHKTVVCA